MRKIERFMKYCELKGLTDSQLCKDLNVGNGTFYAIRKRNTDLSPRLLGIILETYTDINKDWLLTGEGEMLASNNNLESPDLIISRIKITIRDLIKSGQIESQEHLGSMLGHSKTYFSQLVNGKWNNFAFLDEFRKLFPQVDVNWIRTGKRFAAGLCLNEPEMSENNSNNQDYIAELKAEIEILKQENSALKQQLEEYKQNDVQNLDNFFELLRMINEKVDDNSDKLENLENLIKAQQSA